MADGSGPVLHPRPGPVERRGAPESAGDLTGAPEAEKGMERATGFEPATSSLGSSRSTN